nr:talin-2-like isoform X1 [Crassostrea gigas]
MTGIGETADDMDRMYQETLLALAKAVANAMAQLVLKAKSVASTTEDQGLQNKVISSATSCALTTARGLYQEQTDRPGDGLYPRHISTRSL